MAELETTTDNNGEQLWVLLGNGDGTFNVTAGLPSNGIRGTAGPLAEGDFNDDGVSDIALDVSPSSLLVLLGKGDGTFSSISLITNIAQECSYYNPFGYLAVADFAGTGVPGVALGCEGNSSVSPPTGAKVVVLQ